jgi:hypothetical protein
MIFFKRSRFAGRAVDAIRIFTFMVFTATLALSAIAAAQDIAPGTAQGSITINGKKTEFRHAYAVTRLSLSNKKPETVLIISDKPLAANAVTDDVERMKVQSRDNPKMIEIKFDDRKTLTGTNFEVVPLVVSVSSTEFKMNVESFTDKALKGRFNSVIDHKMRDNTYSFDVRFNAAMIAPPSALSGKDAWATPQGKVLAEYLRACRAGDKAAIKKVVIAEVRAELDGSKGADTMNFLKVDSADPKTAEFSSLTVEGNVAKAKITKRSKNSSETTGYELRKVGDTWLVAP